MRPRRNVARSDVQSFYFAPAPNSGTYTITIDGNGSAGIAFGASTTEIKDAIEAITGIGAGKVASVTGAGTLASPYIVTFDASLGDVEEMTVGTSALFEATPGGDTGFVAPQAFVGAWTNRTNAASANNQYTTATAAQSGGISDQLRVADFAIGSLPEKLAVVGFEVEIERKAEVADMLSDSSIALGNAETPESDNKAIATTWPDSDAVATYGGAADLWSFAWPQASSLLSSVGVLVRVQNADTESPREASIDYVAARLYYSTLVESTAAVATVQEGA
jgi:hypothetical protein